jgi:hypothetical protein
MVTKAQRAHAEELYERVAERRRANEPPSQRGDSRQPQQSKPHHRGGRAERHATVAYEVSRTQPSRKSTRRSKNRARAASPLERTVQLRQQQPEMAAQVARARAVVVRGKPPKASR